ncbi:hypothetical protein LCGC14_1971700 [marine sediment metagenome]|uniref:DGC domain protein n=1 Tax=marine sediment metagenome TaxID=412755 RepID=A0A0F9FZM9_9ZZZZ
MSDTAESFSMRIEGTTALCPVGEATGKRMMAEGRIPVISCEGGCIRGEIARLAANMVAKADPYRRGCHGEIFSAPHSAMAKWAAKADRVVVIDGCFMSCHGRMIKSLVAPDKLRVFDALGFYNKYTDVMDMDDVPEADRRQAAREVADAVLAALAEEA